MDNKLIFTAFISQAVSLLPAFPQRYWRGCWSCKTSINYWQGQPSGCGCPSLIAGARPTRVWYLLFRLWGVGCYRVFIPNSLHIFIVINCSEYPHGKRRLRCPPPPSPMINVCMMNVVKGWREWQEVIRPATQLTPHQSTSNNNLYGVNMKLYLNLMVIPRTGLSYLYSFYS